MLEFSNCFIKSAICFSKKRGGLTSREWWIQDKSEWSVNLVRNLHHLIPPKLKKINQNRTKRDRINLMKFAAKFALFLN
jgi:hypothetical protein